MAEPIIVPAALRPWLKSGLSALLLESPERVAQLRAAGPVPAAPVARDHGAAKQSRSVPPPSAMPRPVATTPPVPTLSPVLATPATPLPGAEPVSAASPSTLDTARDSALYSALNSGILPLADWPAPWVALKNRRPLPPRPLVFWTYAGLGDDLMGTANAHRQQAIVRLLSALRHPGGTHVFWPYALPEYAASVPSLFWSGVELLKPRVILIFGSEARDALGLPKSLVPFGQERIHGRLIVQLHQPASLVDDEPLRRAIAFLSRLLDFCAPR